MHKHFNKIAEVFRKILEGGNPSVIQLPDDYPENELRQCTNHINKFVEEYNRFSSAIFELSKGNLNFELNKTRLNIMDSLKNLQSNLRHVTWKMQQVAGGNYNHRIDFMEDFSSSFNMMTEKLKESFEKIRERENYLANYSETLNKRYRNILDNIEEGYYEVDFKGNFTFFSDSLCKILDYSREELMGMNNRQYMDKETAKIVYQTFNRVYTTGEPNRGVNWEVVRKDGTKKIHETSVSLIKDAKGEPVGFRGIVRDVTERKRGEEALTKAYAELKQTQAQLIQAEKAEVIRRLASGVAHEVKNPLAIIHIGIDYLSANPSLDNENVSLTFKYMKEAVGRADNIISGLLNFSRVAEIKRAPENLNSIIEGALLLVKTLFDRYHIEVINEFGKDILSLNLDKSRIEQVFLNLFINAIDVMPGGGQFKIRTYNKELTEVSEEVGRGEGDIFKPGDTAVIAEIEDTGTGIPEGILDKIFDPFFTTKQNKGGTGLGLSIVRSITEVHDGRIKIENRKDRSGVRVALIFKA